MNTPDIEFAFKQIKGRNPVAKEAGVHYLICKYQPLINKLAHQICPTCNIQDMQGAGTLGIMMAIRTYNGESAFGTWVYTQIRNQLQKQREIEFPVKISRFLLKKGNTATFTQVNQEEAYNEDPSKNLTQQEDMEKLTESLRSINRLFPKKHCIIFTEYYFMDKKLNDLTKKYHTNCKYIVSQIIDKLRENSKLL